VREKHKEVHNMAVLHEGTSTRFGIQIQIGTDGNGLPQFATRNFTRVKPAATDDDVYAVATQIASLQAHPVAAVLRYDNSALTESV
jgi:hypothetical protein